jgi:hypothetical protein
MADERLSDVPLYKPPPPPPAQPFVKPEPFAEPEAFAGSQDERHREEEQRKVAAEKHAEAEKQAVETARQALAERAKAQALAHEQEEKALAEREKEAGMSPEELAAKHAADQQALAELNAHPHTQLRQIQTDMAAPGALDMHDRMSRMYIALSRLIGIVLAHTPPPDSTHNDPTGTGNA